MPPKKGLSHEEKRSKLLELFFEKKDFFMLKELEKMAPKEKGVIAQAVKDVLQSLVDDNLVDTDKIGTSVYFWAFSSKVSEQLSVKKNELQQQLTSTEAKLDDLKKKLISVQAQRMDNDDRTKALATLRSVQEKNLDLMKELQKYAENDPETLKLMQQETKLSINAANRWTENIFSIKSWCKNKFFIEDNIFNKQFEVPDDLDYLE